MTLRRLFLIGMIAAMVRLVLQWIDPVHVCDHSIVLQATVVECSK